MESGWPARPCRPAAGEAAAAEGWWRRPAGHRHRGLGAAMLGLQPLPRRRAQRHHGRHAGHREELGARLLRRSLSLVRRSARGRRVCAGLQQRHRDGLLHLHRRLFRGPEGHGQGSLQLHLPHEGLGRCSSPGRWWATASSGTWPTRPRRRATCAWYSWSPARPRPAPACSAATTLVSVNGISADDSSPAGVAVLNEALFGSTTSAYSYVFSRRRDAGAKSIAKLANLVTDPVPQTSVLTDSNGAKIGCSSTTTSPRPRAARARDRRPQGAERHRHGARPALQRRRLSLHRQRELAST